MENLHSTRAGLISEEVELIQEDAIEGSVWHFFTSPVTGQVGPSGPLRDLLKRLNIGIEFTDMAYEIISPPFTLQFSEMSKKELKAYFDWFQSVMPRRFSELVSAVRMSPGFSEWKADYSPASLISLGEWFVLAVETKKRSEAEIEEITSRLTFPMEIPDKELSNRTFSIAMDIGMYMSGVFLKNHPELHWKQEFGSKNYIDYGQPVLADFDVSSFNPVRMIVGLGYGIASKNKGANGLSNLYEIWSKKIRVRQR